MKRKIFVLLYISLLLIVFSGCSANDNGHKSDPYPSEGSTEEIVVYSSVRKIIYSASANLYIEENFKEKIATLKDSINDDEWTDSENISDYSAYFIFRIKTTRLDEFIDSLSTYGEVKNFNKKATDISLQYQDTSNQIIALEAEKARLVELYGEANMTEIIQINTRISQIDKELRVLKGEIIQFDSQIEYSEVQVSIYNEAPEEDVVSYGQKLMRSFKTGGKAFIKFFEYLSLGLVTIFPLALVFVAVGVGIYYLRKLYLNKKKNNNRD